MNKLDKAKEYIAENKLDKTCLPVFHVTSEIGWINDPNGFSFYQGKAHLFYQYHPYSTEWGPMHWGHCISDDFIRWKNCPVALAPDENYDVEGCFSGSAIETPQGHALVYTGVSKECINGKEEIRQNQCLAIGDGCIYKKVEQNPVATGSMLPENFSREDFRDPKIWQEEDGYYMVVGNKTCEAIPQIVLFHSNDLTDWNYVSVLARDVSGQYGMMWECPDFFELDGEHVLICSPQDMCADEEFHSGNNAVSFHGKYDREKYVFSYDRAHALDDGTDFYAPQTMQTEDGRRIMIAWMQSWDSNIRPAEQKWAGMMTLPRELHLVNGRIQQTPVRELEKYYTDPVCYTNEVIAGACHLKGIEGRVLDLVVELKAGDFQEFEIRFAQNDRYYTSFLYNQKKNELELDRRFSGMIRDALAFRRVKVKYPKEQLKIRMILDKFSAEIFINDGEQVLSTTFYTPLDADQIQFICDGSAQVDIQKYTISVEQ